MQPFHLAEQVKDAYYRYISTFYPIQLAELRAEFERLVHASRLLWHEPFVSP